MSSKLLKWRNYFNALEKKCKYFVSMLYLNHSKSCTCKYIDASIRLSLTWYRKSLLTFLKKFVTMDKAWVYQKGHSQ